MGEYKDMRIAWKCESLGFSGVSYYLICWYPTETVKVTILPSGIPSQTSMRKSVCPQSNSSVQGTSGVRCFLHAASEVQDSASANVKRKWDNSTLLQLKCSVYSMILRFWTCDMFKSFQKFAESWTNRAEPPDFCYFTSITSRTHLKYEARTKHSLCHDNSTWTANQCGGLLLFRAARRQKQGWLLGRHSPLQRPWPVWFDL